MASSMTQTPPTPMRFFRAVMAFQESAAIKAAIELGVFTLISEGFRDPASMAARCQAAERGVRILCDYLAVQGFLTRDATGAYDLAPDAAWFLNRHSPAYVGDAIKFLLAPMHVAYFRDLTATVRNGGCPDGDGSVSPDNPVWVEFAHSMEPLMRMPARAMAERLAGHEPIRVLDIAAGHGRFGIEIARANPRAEVTALDWANVLEVAKENAAQAGVSERYRTITGSAFAAPFEGPYDLVLLTNFLHHFDPPTCEGLLRKVREALRDGGRVATLEFVVNEDRVSPPASATFSLTMLGGTKGGDAYTFAEYDRMFRNAGYGASELVDLPGGEQRLIVTSK